MLVTWNAPGLGTTSTGTTPGPLSTSTFLVRSRPTTDRARRRENQRRRGWPGPRSSTVLGGASQDQKQEKGVTFHFLTKVEKVICAVWFSGSFTLAPIWKLVTCARPSWFSKAASAAIGGKRDPGNSIVHEGQLVARQIELVDGGRIAAVDLLGMPRALKNSLQCVETLERRAGRWGSAFASARTPFWRPPRRDRCFSSTRSLAILERASLI